MPPTRPLPRWNDPVGRIQLVLFLLFLLLMVVEHINGRFWLNDFRVYYGAAEALRQGEPLYGVAHGLDSGIFKYAPVMALFYLPFTLLPYTAAATLQYLLIALAFVDGLRRLDSLLRTQLIGQPAARPLVLWLFALLMGVHLHRELHLGNINMLLLWGLLVALHGLLSGARTWPGLLLGAIILAKPHFAVLLPLLVLRGHLRALGLACIAIAAGLLLPALFLGFSANAEALRAWAATMATHNADLIYIAGDDKRAINTLYTIVYRTLLQHFLPPSPLLPYVLLALVAAGFGGFVLRDRLRRSTHGSPGRFALEYLLLVALVPSITLTDTQHFLLAGPIVLLTLLHLFQPGRARWLPWVAVPLLVAYGGNWEDPLGPVSDMLANASALGIGSFGLVLLNVFLATRSDNRPLPTSNP